MLDSYLKVQFKLRFVTIIKVHYMRHLPEPHILLFRRKKAHPIPSDFGRHQQMLEQAAINREYQDLIIND